MFCHGVSACTCFCSHTDSDIDMSWCCVSVVVCREENFGPRTNRRYVTISYNQADVITSIFINAPYIRTSHLMHSNHRTAAPKQCAVSLYLRYASFTKGFTKVLHTVSCTSFIETFSRFFRHVCRGPFYLGRMLQSIQRDSENLP